MECIIKNYNTNIEQDFQDISQLYEINKLLATNKPLVKNYKNMAQVSPNISTFKFWITADVNKLPYDKNTGDVYLYQANLPEKDGTFFLTVKDLIIMYFVYIGENNYLKDHSIALDTCFNVLKKRFDNVHEVLTSDSNDLFVNGKKIFGIQTKKFNKDIHLEVCGFNWSFKENKDLFAQAYNDTKFYEKTMNYVTGIKDELPDTDYNTLLQELCDEMNRLIVENNII
jgi:hypothetical protein